MTTAIATRPDANQMIGVAKQLGETVAKSKLFGCQNEAQAELIAYESLYRGRPILSLAEEFDIVHGKLRRKAEATLAQFRAAGGKCIWITEADDAKQQRARWVWKENDTEIGYTIEEAERAGLVKDDSNWDKYPADMLASRAITRAIKRIAPEIVHGYASPDEVSGDYDSPSFAAEVESQVLNSASEGNLVDDARVGEQAALEAPSQAEVVQPTETDSDASQAEIINSLFDHLELSPDKRAEVLRKRGVAAARSLTPEQADELIANLQALREKRRQEAASEDTEFSSSIHGPVPDEMVAQIREAIKAAAQSGMPKLANEVKSHLKSSGLSALADMTFNEGRQLLKAIEAKATSQFFENALKGHAKKN